MKKLIPAIFLIAIMLLACTTEEYSTAIKNYTVYGTADSVLVNIDSWSPGGSSSSIYYKENYPVEFTVTYYYESSPLYLKIWNISDTGDIIVEVNGHIADALLPDEQYFDSN